MNYWSKIKNILNNCVEWIVVLILFLSGYFVWSYLFKKTNTEKQILDNIKDNVAAIDELEKMSKELEKKDKSLEKKENEVTDAIKIKEEEIIKETNKFEEKKKKIIKNESNQSAIDYLNNNF